MQRISIGFTKILDKLFQLEKLIASDYRKILFRVYRNAIIPIKYFHIYRYFSIGNNILSSNNLHLIQFGRELSDKFLAEALDDVELGGWPLDIETIEWLGKYISENKPRGIIEFGSGYSTVCLAYYLRLIWGGDGGIRLFSIEQNEEYAFKTTNLLTSLGLSNIVTVLWRPLAKKTVLGNNTVCYNIQNDEIVNIITDQSIDMCIVDGPIASTGSRYGTIPLVYNAMNKDAVVILDDALRDEELKIATIWEKEMLINIQGIIPIGKGILYAKKGEMPFIN